MTEFDRIGWYGVPPWGDTKYQVWGSLGTPGLIFWGFLNFQIFGDFSRAIFQTALAPRWVEVSTWNFWWKLIPYRPKSWWGKIWKIWKFSFFTFFKPGFLGWPHFRNIAHGKYQNYGYFHKPHGWEWCLTKFGSGLLGSPIITFPQWNFSPTDYG